MPISQNATFSGPEGDSMGEQIRGISIVRFLVADLQETGVRISEVECWRDAGWIFEVLSDTCHLQVIVVADHVRESRWILQISPHYVPGFLSSWFGRTASATPQNLFDMAVQCYEILVTYGYDDFQWCWDDFAEGKQCAPKPLPPV